MFPYFAITILITYIIIGKRFENNFKKGINKYPRNKFYIYSFLIASTCIILEAFIEIKILEYERKKTFENYDKKRQEEYNNYLLELSKPKEKDSIDYIIDDRKTEKFEGTIFAGLKFGDNKQTVDYKLRNNKNNLEIFVPDGNYVENVYISRYDALYYKNKLASLILYSEQYKLYDALCILYATKYGETKSGKWTFSNCEIKIEINHRKLRDPIGDAGYRSNPSGFYYDSYNGEKTDFLTKNSSFLKISYQNFNLMEQIERDKFIQDSLKEVERINKIKKEKELAKKLAMQPATNI